MRLNQLRDNDGAAKLRTRVGRGIGSGKGKTGGRGVKGQKSRSGVAIKGFEGGQMPLHRRLPKRGFTNIFAKDYNTVSVGRVQKAIDAGKLNASEAVTVEALKAAGVVKRVRDGVRIVANGEITAAVTFEVAGASKGAVAAIESRDGGKRAKRQSLFKNRTECNAPVRCRCANHASSLDRRNQSRDHDCGCC